MKKLVIIIVCFIFFSSCSILKEAQKEKTNTEIENDITSKGNKITEEKVKGGKIESDILPESQREKDENGLFKEFIQTFVNGGLTKTIIYKPDGSVHTTCEQEEIYRKVIENYIIQDKSRLEQETKDKQSKKEEKINSEIVLYFMFGFALIVLILAFFGFKILSKNTAILNKMLLK